MKMKQKGQGSISYLLLIGGAIIMASIAVFLLYGIGEEGKGYTEKGIFVFENKFKELENVVKGCGDGVCETSEECPEDCCQSDCTVLNAVGWCRTYCNGVNGCSLTLGMPDWAEQGKNTCVSETSYAEACEGNPVGSITNCSTGEKCYEKTSGAECVQEASIGDGTCDSWETCAGSPSDCDGEQADCETGFRCIQMPDGKGYCLKENDKCALGVENGVCSLLDQCGCGDCEGETIVCSAGEICFQGNCLKVNENCLNGVENGYCETGEGCSCGDCEGKQNGCEEGQKCVDGSCRPTTGEYTCGDTSCEYWLGESIENCPTDCCESDCTASYDSICYAACNTFNGCSMDYPEIMDGNVSGKPVCIDESSEAIACTGSAVACEADEKCAFGQCRKIDLDCVGGVLNEVCEATEDCSCSDCSHLQNGCGEGRVCCVGGCYFPSSHQCGYEGGKVIT